MNSRKASWFDCKLEDFVTLQRGHDLPSKERKDGDFPIVSSSGITGYHVSAKAKGPGVITGRYGTLGKVFYVTGDYWPLNTTLYVRDFKGNVPQFVAYFLETLHLERFNAAGAVPGLNRNHLHKLKVRIPDTRTQERCANVLSKHDELIANNTHRISLIEQVAGELFREWFLRLRFPGFDNKKIVGGVPDRWKRVALSEVVTINPREPLNKDTMKPYIPMSSLNEASMIIDEIEQRSGSSGAKFRNGDTLLARITPCLENGKTGFVQCLEPDQVGIGSTEFIVLREGYLNRFYIYFLARSEFLRRHAIGSMKGSDGRQRVNIDAFKAIEISAPNELLLEQFDQSVRAMFEQIHILSLMNSKLYRARNMLLPKLVAGELLV